MSIGRGAPREIEVRIEELVLYGFPSRNRHRIAEAVEWSLARLLTEQGVPSHLLQEAEIPALDDGAFDVTPVMGPEAIGARIARTVHRGLNR